MREFRKDYILNRWVLINTDRSKRPSEYKREREKPTKGICPFCPGNEHLTPPEIERIEKGGKWIMRVVPNKYPAVRLDEDWKIKKANHFFTHSSAFGKHEVIIETPKHDEQLADFSVEGIKMLLELYIKRFKAISRDKRIKQIAIFKNEGREAGCSLSHPHTQIIAYNRLANAIDEKMKAAEAYKREYGKCPYCEIIKIEKKGPRAVYENDSVFTYAPYASRFAFEVRITPKKHINRITELSEKQLLDLAEAIKFILVRLKKLNAPYNMYFRNAPEGRELHFHVKINPRILSWGGFEYETDCVINTVSPEDAAKYYRGEK